MKKKIITRRLFWTTLFMALCAIFPVFSQGNGEGNDAAIDKRLRKEMLREHIRQEKLRWKEEDRKARMPMTRQEQEMRQKKEKEMEKNFSVAYHPIALLTEGSFKFDYNARLVKKHWLQVTPAIYFFPGMTCSYTESSLSPFNNYDYNNNKIQTLRGAGLGIGYKYYPSPKETFFLLMGVNYSYFEAGYHGYNFPEYGYGTHDAINGTQYFNNLRAFVCLGIHTPMRKGFFVGGNFGLGYQYSFYNKEKPAFDKNIFDYGYRWCYPILEFYLGFAW